MIRRLRCLPGGHYWLRAYTSDPVHRTMLKCFYCPRVMNR
jgi:hypothetical protein